MRRTQWTLAAAVLAVAAAGIGGCGASAASPRPIQEIPMLSGALDAKPPTEWTSAAPVQQTSAVATPSDPGTPAPPPRNVNIEQAVRKVAKSATAAAVVVKDRQAAGVVLSERPDRGFYAGSLVKLLVGVDALARHSGDSRVSREITYMIQRSDDALCSKYWMSEGGGASIIARMRQRMGLRGTKAPSDPGQWGNTIITANDMVRVYDYLLGEAPPGIRQPILDGMASATEYGSDGFRQWFGIPVLGSKGTWAVKQGWTTSGNGQMSVHSTGLVGDNWRFVVVLLTEHPEGQKFDNPARSVTAAATAIAPFLK